MLGDPPGLEAARHKRCGCERDERVRQHSSVASDHALSGIAERREQSDRALLDESGLMSLMLAVAWLHADSDSLGAVDAAAAVVALAAAATPMATLVDAWQHEGELGVAARIDEMGMRGLLAWLPPAPMHTMSGSIDFAPSDLPDLPGGDLPGMPGRGIPRIHRDDIRLIIPSDDIPGDPETIPLPKTINDILDKLTPKRRRWDPDDWCPMYPWWREPVLLVDYDWFKFSACLREMFRRIQARAAIPPPVRPARVTWSDGITSRRAARAPATPS